MFIEVHNGRPDFETQIARINIQYIVDYGNIIRIPEQYKARKENFKAKTWINTYPSGQYYVQETVEQIDEMIASLLTQSPE